jgi:hypothetical protein
LRVFVSIEFDDFRNLLILCFMHAWQHPSAKLNISNNLPPGQHYRMSVRPRTSNNFSFWIKICNRDVLGCKSMSRGSKWDPQIGKIMPAKNIQFIIPEMFSWVAHRIFGAF